LIVDKVQFEIETESNSPTFVLQA